MNIDNDVYERSKEVTVIESVLKDGQYSCKSKGSKNEWTVTKDAENFYCDCPAFQKNRTYCKHTVAIMTYEKITFAVNPPKSEPDKDKKKPDKIIFNFDDFEVISAFHKSLRKSDVVKAWFFAEIIFQEKSWNLFEYLDSILASELCICDPGLVAGLKSYLNPQKSNDVFLLYAAIDIFCSVKKAWECGRCWERKVERAQKLNNIKNESEPRFDIPHYALDRHTKRGKELPEGDIDQRTLGTWLSNYWRRQCIEQDKDINQTEWQDVILDEKKVLFFKNLDSK